MAKTIFLQEPQEFNKMLAGELKKVKEFSIPEWAFFVKSGQSKVRPPQEEDFWFKRAASILRQAYIQGVIGVSSLRTKYGSKKRRGGRPAKFRRASGKIIRLILQQAEQAGILEKIAFHGQFGRRLTPKGRNLLDSIKTSQNYQLTLPEPGKQPTTPDFQSEDNLEIVEESEDN